MTHEPIAERLEHDWDAFKAHLPHRHHSATMQATPPPEAAMSLITTIEADLASVGHTIDQAAHDILSKHLGLANIAAHVANETAALANSPLAKVVETAAGLNAAEQAFVAKAASDAAAWLAELYAPVAAPADVPAEPVPAPVA
jgi:hypothetical protein